MPDLSTVSGVVVVLLVLGMVAGILWLVMEWFDFDPQDRLDGEQ